MGGENPLTIHEIYAALTPSDSQSDWASESAAATPGCYCWGYAHRQRIIKSKVKIRVEGCFFGLKSVLWGYF